MNTRRFLAVFLTLTFVLLFTNFFGNFHGIICAHDKSKPVSTSLFLREAKQQSTPKENPVLKEILIAEHQGENAPKSPPIAEQSKKKILLIVCHPDDESIFGATVLGENTHVIMVTDANSQGKGISRRKHLGHAMKIANTSWEMWDFPETKNYRPSNKQGWSTQIQKKLVKRLTDTLLSLKAVRRIVTHNHWGEYGHIDHRNVHKATCKAFESVFKNRYTEGAPSLEVFLPNLDYENMVDRLAKPPQKCTETPLHKALLDSYQKDGSLSNAFLFRPLCYDLKVLVPPVRWKVVSENPLVVGHTDQKVELEMVPELTASKFGDLQNAHSKLALMLQEVHRICKENDIEYTLRGGNLVGLLRYADWIPWDGDIDIMMKLKDKKRATVAFEKELLKSPDWIFQTKENDPKFHTSYSMSKFLFRHSCYIGKGKYFNDWASHKKYKNRGGIFFDIFWY